jgi:hypothetical protein
MNDFSIFAETPCITLDKLKLKGVPQNSGYMQNLEAACSQKMQPDKAFTTKNNLLRTAGIGALIISLGAVVFLIIKKI